MAYAIDHPHRSHWWRRRPLASAGDMQISVRPLGASGVALLTALVAAWGGISAFVGPVFGYRPTSVNAWTWSTPNWLLHLVPGAVGLVAGLMMLGMAAETVARRSRLMLAGLMALAAGAWFVLGPALWATIESGSPYGRAASAGDGFINALGANLGPGLLLAFLAGMAIKTAIAVPRVRMEPLDLDRERAAAYGPATDRDSATDYDSATGIDPVSRYEGSREAEGPVARRDRTMTGRRRRWTEPAPVVGPDPMAPGGPVTTGAGSAASAEADRVRPVTDADVIERDRGSGPERPL